MIELASGDFIAFNDVSRTISPDIANCQRVLRDVTSRCNEVGRPCPLPRYHGTHAIMIINNRVARTESRMLHSLSRLIPTTDCAPATLRLEVKVGTASGYF